MDNLILAKFKNIEKMQNDNMASITGGLKYKGILNASNLGTQLDNSKKGDFYKVSVGGTILTSLVLNIGDMVIVNKDVVGIPAINDLDIIDNTENINNPISIDDSVNILNLPNGYYTSDGLFNINNGYPFTTASSSHNTIMVTGGTNNKNLILFNTNTSGFLYFRVQVNGIWGSWRSVQPLDILTTVRKSTESMMYTSMIGSNYECLQLFTGIAPTNSSVALKTGLSSSAKLIAFDGWINKLGGTQRVPIQSVIQNTTDLSSPVIYQDISSGTIYMQMNNTNYNGQSYEITLYYTK